MPAFEDLYSVTREFVPTMFVAVWMFVLCTNWPLTKTVGSRLGIADPASCTFRPLNTPPWPLPAPRFAPVPPDPSCVLARTPIEADDGPCEMLFDTFRKRAPALAR